MCVQEKGTDSEKAWELKFTSETNIGTETAYKS